MIYPSSLIDKRNICQCFHSNVNFLVLFPVSLSTYAHMFLIFNYFEHGTTPVASVGLRVVVFSAGGFVCVNLVKLFSDCVAAGQPIKCLLSSKL